MRRLAWWAALAGVPLWLLARRYRMLDLEVYRAGGRAWREGVPLYEEEFPERSPDRLPFTYPPVAAVLFTGLDVLPKPAATTAMTAASLLALRASCDLVAPAGWGTFLALASWPVRRTFSLGQINLLLMALTVQDCLLPRTPWPRGAMLGLASALKLTPAIFVLHFLAGGQWRAAATCVASFAGLHLLAWPLAPRDSARYWGHVVWRQDRVQPISRWANQSAMGVLLRLGAPRAAWRPLVALFLGLGWRASRRALRRGDALGSLLAWAAAGLLSSPVSWTHHWVWMSLGAAALSARSPAAAAAAALALAPKLPRDTQPEGPLQHVLGNPYVLAGLGYLLR